MERPWGQPRTRSAWPCAPRWEGQTLTGRRSVKAWPPDSRASTCNGPRPESTGLVWQYCYTLGHSGIATARVQQRFCKTQQHKPPAAAAGGRRSQRSTQPSLQLFSQRSRQHHLAAVPHRYGLDAALRSHQPGTAAPPARAPGCPPGPPQRRAGSTGACGSGSGEAAAGSSCGGTSGGSGGGSACCHAAAAAACSAVRRGGQPHRHPAAGRLLCLRAAPLGLLPAARQRGRGQELLQVHWGGLQGGC